MGGLSIAGSRSLLLRPPKAITRASKGIPNRGIIHHQLFLSAASTSPSSSISACAIILLPAIESSLISRSESGSPLPSMSGLSSPLPSKSELTAPLSLKSEFSSPLPLTLGLSSPLPSRLESISPLPSISGLSSPLPSKSELSSGSGRLTGETGSD